MINFIQAQAILALLIAFNVPTDQANYIYSMIYQPAPVTQATTPVQSAPTITYFGNTQIQPVNNAPQVQSPVVQSQPMTPFTVQSASLNENPDGKFYLRTFTNPSIDLSQTILPNGMTIGAKTIVDRQQDNQFVNEIQVLTIPKQNNISITLVAPDGQKKDWTVSL